MGGGDNLSSTYRNKEEASQIINNQWFVKILRGGDNLRAVIGEQERGIELIKNQCISEKIGGGDNLSRSYRNKL